LAARFQLEPENTAGYLGCLDQLITTHGVPLSLYRDRHSIFQRNDPHWTPQEELLGHQFPTHVGQTLELLGIQQIPANSPQANGRIERLWRTLQDRLISELRLANACTLEQANRVLAAFCADFNHRFAVPASQSGNDFRSLPRGFDLARWLTVSASVTSAPWPQTTPSILPPKPFNFPPPLPFVAMPSRSRTLSPTRRLTTHLSRRPTLALFIARSKNSSNPNPPPAQPPSNARCLASTTSVAVLLWLPPLKNLRW